ncbi:hypothetical protein ACWEF9_34240 [Streptomyces sp. NPDC004980]
MITQGVKVTVPCDGCGEPLVLDVGQFLDHGGLWWGTEGACTACANAWCEQDTGGATPEWIRNALLTEHGPAELRLADNESGPVPVMRVLRELFGLTLKQARESAEALRRTGLVGTAVEMELIADGLRRRSVATYIRCR